MLITRSGEILSLSWEVYARPFNINEVKRCELTVTASSFSTAVQTDSVQNTYTRSLAHRKKERERRKKECGKERDKEKVYVYSF